MSATFSRPKNNLAWRAGRKGVSRTEAVARADGKVEEIRAESLAYIDANLESLTRLMAAAAVEPPSIEKLYDAGAAIADTAGVFGLAPMGRAAHSLCELLSQFEQAGCWKPEPVQLHVSALLVLRRGPASDSDPAAEKLLKDLSLMLAHLTSRLQAGGPL